MTIQPKPADIDLLLQIIDLRDSAHLAGHTDKPFNLLKLNGGQSVLASPGNAGGTNVSTFAVQRLEDLALFRGIVSKKNGMTFDLVDDVRDRLEEMKIALGQPSRMGEAEAAKERAIGAHRDLEAKVEAASALRAERRIAFAGRVGRWVRSAATIALAVIYIGVVVLAGQVISSILPLPLIVTVIALAAILGILDWLLRIDGFALAAMAEASAVRRVTGWLESFDAEP